MSGPAMKWAGRQQVADPSLKSVLVAVAWFARPDGTAWPSQDTLAQRTGLSVRGVRRALAELSALGAIKRKARSRGAQGRTSDLITLPIETEVEITVVMIRNLRRARVASGQLVRLQRVVTGNSQPANSVIATGQIGRGIGSDQQNPAKKERAQVLVEGNTGPTLKVISGGRP